MTKTFLITGATDGVGRITGKILAGQDHEVLVHGRTDTAAALEAAESSLAALEEEWLTLEMERGEIEGGGRQ